MGSINPLSIVSLLKNCSFSSFRIKHHYYLYVFLFLIIHPKAPVLAEKRDIIRLREIKYIMEIKEETINQTVPLDQDARIAKHLNRVYPEDVIRLSSKCLGGKLLRPTGEEAGEYSYGDTDKKVTGKRGNFTLSGMGQKLQVFYSINLHRLPVKLELLYKKEGDIGAGTTQIINLDIQESNQGLRWEILCPSCSRRCRVLYLTKPGTLFGCRFCKNINYSVCYINKRSKSGIYFYYINRLTSLFDINTKTDRPFRNGKPIKKLQRAIDKHNKYKMELPEGLRNVLEIKMMLAIDTLNKAEAPANTM
jgi:hypothetical protein